MRQCLFVSHRSAFDWASFFDLLALGKQVFLLRLLVLDWLFDSFHLLLIVLLRGLLNHFVFRRQSRDFSLECHFNPFRLGSWIVPKLVNPWVFVLILVAIVICCAIGVVLLMTSCSGTSSLIVATSTTSASWSSFRSLLFFDIHVFLLLWLCVCRLRSVLVIWSVVLVVLRSLFHVILLHQYIN